MASLYTLSLLSTPENIRYVGITKYSDVERRLKAHKEKAGKVNRPVADWIAKHQEEVLVLKVAEYESWDEACNAEVQMIASLKERGFKLLNMTAGGDGSLGKKDSEETRMKKAAAGRGRTVSEETRKKISLANTGKKRSEEARKKMSDAKIGKKLHPDHVEKVRNKLIGRKCSPETAEKIASAQRGRKFPPERVENIKAGQKRRRERERNEKLKGDD